MSARDAFARLAAIKNLCADLEAAGYRLLAPGEIDPDTVKRCAEVADSVSRGMLSAEMPTDATVQERRRLGQLIAVAIRSLNPEGR